MKRSSSISMADWFPNLSRGTSSRFQTAFWSVKMVLLFAGIISTAAVVKAAVVIPCFDLIVSVFPSLWISIRGLLSPPYIYIVFNFIVLAVAACSTIANPHHHRHQQQQNRKEKHQIISSNVPYSTIPLPIDDRDTWYEVVEDDQHAAESSSHEEFSGESCLTESDSSGAAATGEYSAESGSPTTMRKKESSGDLENDTMEGVWRAIMEKAEQPKRQLKKSDTWDTPPRVAVEDGESPAAAAAVAGAIRRERGMKKWETFRLNRLAHPPRAVRGSEELPSQDELNRRVEAFIHKFRLQRQESDQRFMEMVNRAI